MPIVDTRRPGVDLGKRVESGGGTAIIAVFIDLEDGPASTAESSGRR